MRTKALIYAELLLGACLSASARVVEPVPEPTTYLAGALMLGVLGFAFLRGRRKK
jgi:MYXO-CTERM domain-containing protein